MSKTKKITFNMLAAGLPKIEKQVLQYGEFEIEVTPTLPIKKMLEFVDDVVATCVDIDSGSYLPEVYELALNLAMLHHYAGFEKAKDIEKAYRVVRETDICERVFELIDHKQYHEIVVAIDDRISFALQVMAVASGSSVMKLINKMDDVINSSTEALGALNSDEMHGMLDELSRLQMIVEGDAELDAENTQPQIIEVDNVIPIPGKKI